MIESLNKFIVETYKEDRALKATVQNGFAMVSQKVQVKGLKLLAAAKIATNGNIMHYPEGSTVYIKEAALQSQPWAKQAFTAPEAIMGEFMIVDQAHVEFVDPNWGRAEVMAESK